IFCIASGIYPTIHIIQLFLYVPFAYIATSAVAILTSTLGVLIRDTQMMMQALMRVLFYASPILWVAKPGSIVQKILMLNPIYFIAESYRAAVLYHNWYFIDHWQLALYNVFIVVFIFFVGSILHMRYRDQFADFM
ncbi:MAG: teichoic acid ABC transporter permease, partial [Staphylococcus simulans]|nr:teichoic acid ABC transporter permease [Staphylococcus simulans]